MEMEGESSTSPSTTTTTGTKDNGFEKIDHQGNTVDDEFSQASSEPTEPNESTTTTTTTTRETTKEKEKEKFETKVINKAAENLKGNVEKNVKQGIEKVTKAISSSENISQVQKRLDKLWASFLAPSTSAKRDVTIYGLPPAAVEIVTWYRPKVTTAIATMCFLFYFLLLLNEYTVLGLISTIAYLLLLFVIVARNLLPFFGKESRSFALIPKDKIEKLVKDCVDAAVVVVNCIAAIINCDDFTNTFSSLVSIYVFSVVANNVSGMFFCLCLLSFHFHCSLFLCHQEEFVR